jgi:hypothetical protein
MKHQCLNWCKVEQQIKQLLLFVTTTHPSTLTAMPHFSPHQNQSCLAVFLKISTLNIFKAYTPLPDKRIPADTSHLPIITKI